MFPTIWLKFAVWDDSVGLRTSDNFFNKLWFPLRLFPMAQGDVSRTEGTPTPSNISCVPMQCIIAVCAPCAWHMNPDPVVRSRTHGGF
jgi:hypothetical protein